MRHTQTARLFARLIEPLRPRRGRSTVSVAAQNIARDYGYHRA